MSALSARRGLLSRLGLSSRAAAPDGALVLPRWLRRPARAFRHLLSGEVEAPRYAATALTAGFLAVTGVYGMIVGGHTSTVVQAFTARSGFAMSDIRVSGNLETSEIDIIQQIGLDGWTSLIGFDAEAARARIAGLPWVESASVQKVYPDRIDVKITERRPFAIWQHGSQLTVVEKDGSIIAPFTSQRHAALPLVVGMGAAREAGTLVDRMAQFPGIASRAVGYMRIGERRWDVRLENGVTLRLPEGREDEALAEVAELDDAYDILSRDVLVVDLRLPDRLVVKLTPEAATHRASMIEDRLDSKRKAGRRI